MEEPDFRGVAQQIAAMPLGKVAKHRWTEEAKAGATERLRVYTDRRYQFGGGLVRHCAHCSQPAVRGRLFCRFHGGQKKEGRPPWRMFARFIVKMIRHGRMPSELLQHPCWPSVRRVLGREKWQEPVRALVIAACEMSDGDPTARARFVQALARLKQEGMTW